MLMAPLTAAGGEVAAPGGPIEAKYEKPGPMRVAKLMTRGPCDRRGNACEIFYPADLGPEGTPHPVITWANGTDKTPSPAGKYDFMLTHLASWGFVVVATRDGTTGVGDTVLDAATYLLAQGRDPASPFYRRLDAARVGAAGHSQGASGAANAMLHSRGAIRTAVMLHLPQQAFCKPADNCLLTRDLEGARAGSVFYVSGTSDFIISPDDQLGGAKLNSLNAYYRHTPDRLPKVKALVRGGNHNDVTGRPGCPPGMGACGQGAQAYLGYPTAWLMWRLQGAADARGAFVAGGELFRAPRWTRAVGNIR
ncbi:MAG: alpha/beta hydrolase [Alphaproteobacteria bacterium]|nr:alpha/beta hydrolase [Alphaproteobacteria bacterium]MBU2092502.1 alpha/beta hydrolase [Alphaproteobacteria bacterium]MBU2152367.1 alpha/beta hydrolase [Alphaproteobacteria bacterium]MBU2305578.1 alpha/beta hydrolase [Alphaproteobacteria bacterium]MBU2365542.1 alpha/beta hydrolase [Alphaproteobacteria bacterium]